jgi:hypothetical protein
MLFIIPTPAFLVKRNRSQGRVPFELRMRRLPGVPSGKTRKFRRCEMAERLGGLA